MAGAMAAELKPLVRLQRVLNCTTFPEVDDDDIGITITDELNIGPWTIKGEIGWRISCKG